MIFVDELFSWSVDLPYRNAQAREVGKRHGHRWCHMTSDESTVETPELDAFARRLGLKVAYRHKGHFDLVPPLRDRAIELGARPLTRRQWFALRRAKYGIPRLPPHGSSLWLIDWGDERRVLEDEHSPATCPRCQILEALLASTR